MQKFQLTLLWSCVLIGLGLFIIFQSDYVNLPVASDRGVHPVEEDGATASLSPSQPALPEGKAKPVHADAIASDVNDNTTNITKITGAFHRNDPSQTSSNDEVGGETWPESPMTGYGGNTIINQNSQTNQPITISINVVPAERNASGESFEEIAETLNASEPIRRNTPSVEVQASDWLANGDENGVREDPVPFIWPTEKR
jgi:hypothetical protein